MMPQLETYSREFANSNLECENKSTKGCFGPVPGKFLGIVGQDPSDSKFNRLHVKIV